MSNDNLFLNKIYALQHNEYFNVPFGRSVFDNDDSYFKLISIVNEAVENSSNVNYNIGVYSPIEYEQHYYHLDYRGMKVPVTSKPTLTAHWGYRSIAILGDKYAVIHMVAENNSNTPKEYAILSRGFDDYIPLTPTNYDTDVFKMIPESMLFWEKDGDTNVSDLESNMDKLFQSLGEYVIHKRHIVREVLGYDNYGFNK